MTPQRSSDCRKKSFCPSSIFLGTEDFLLVQEEDKAWSPEKLKMVKKHFFPELSGDLWGVICYHHWYPRAGIEGRKKISLFKKSFEVKKDAELHRGAGLVGWTEPFTGPHAPPP